MKVPRKWILLILIKKWLKPIIKPKRCLAKTTLLFTCLFLVAVVCHFLWRLFFISLCFCHRMRAADWLVPEPATVWPANHRADPPSPLGDGQRRTADRQRQHNTTCHHSWLVLLVFLFQPAESLIGWWEATSVWQSLDWWPSSCGVWLWLWRECDVVTQVSELVVVSVQEVVNSAAPFPVHRRWSSLYRSSAPAPFCLVFLIQSAFSLKAAMVGALPRNQLQIDQLVWTILPIFRGFFSFAKKSSNTKNPCG